MDEQQIMEYEVEETGWGTVLDEHKSYKAVLVVVAILVALVSFFLGANHFSQPETYGDTIASLDAKKADVTKLVAASTAVSAAITAIPGDAGTPIAEKLVDLSGDFLVVLTAIYLEKYLLTTLGFAAFKILIPLACILLVIAALVRNRTTMRGSLARLSAKLALFACAIVLVVPASVFMSNMIETTYSESINATMEGAKSTAENAAGTVQNQTESESTATEQSAQVSQDTQGVQKSQDVQEEGVASFLQSLIGRLEKLPENIQQGVTGVTADVQNTLNNFIEALAIMIVTSCVIPVLVLVFFLWIVKLILGVDLNIPTGVLRPRVMGRH